VSSSLSGDQRQRLVVTVLEQAPLLQAAPPLQSLLVVQVHRLPEPQVEVAPPGTGQFASVEQAPPVSRQVPVEAWQALPVQSAFVAQMRPATAKVAEQSVDAVVHPPFTQLLPLGQSELEPHWSVP
jgi:hypothetical protein